MNEGTSTPTEARVDDQILAANLLDNISDNIYFKDLNSRFTRISKAQAEWFGLHDPSQAIGKTDFDFFSAEHARQALADEQQIIRTGLPVVGKVEKETWPDGHVTWVSTTKFPLRDEQGHVVGTFGISRDITERKQAEEQIARYAQALHEKNRQIEADLQLAGDLQQALLPKQFPSFPPTIGSHDSDLRFYYRYRPTAALGGDFFDVLALSDSEAGVIICDVMGKGVRAALITAMMRALVQELSPIATGPGDLLGGLNRGLLATLRQLQMPLFVSAFYAVADVAAGEVRFASAGHPPAFHLRRRAGTIEKLEPATGKSAPALGLMDDVVYQTSRHALDAGDLILLFTDGLYEVMNANDEEYGLERLVAGARQRIGLAPAEMLDDLLADVLRFAGDQEFRDDVCLLSVDVQRLRPAAPPRR